MRVDMAEFERVAVVSATPQLVFGVLANPRETSSWAHGLLHLEPTDDAGAEPDHGHHDAELAAAPDRMRVEWSDRDGAYAGWAQVADHRGVGAEVTIHLSLTGDLEPGSRQEAAQVTEEMDSVLDGLCTRIEGGGS